MVANKKAGREPAVRAGLKLLDEHGLDGLTLGAIAKELNVRAPTLYWRFSSKQDLVDAMATQIIADWISPLALPVRGDGWRSWTIRFATTFRASLKRHRDGARLVAGTFLNDGVDLDAMEHGLRVYEDAGIRVGDAILCCRTLYDYVVGFTIEEQAVVSQAGIRDPRYSIEERSSRMGGSKYPLSTQAGPFLLGDFETRFAEGVELIVTGFAARSGAPNESADPTTALIGTEDLP